MHLNTFGLRFAAGQKSIVPAVDLDSTPIERKYLDSIQGTLVDYPALQSTSPSFATNSRHSA